MEWENRRQSENVEDARGRRTGGGGTGLAVLANLVLRLFGLKGLLVLALLGVVAWQMGVLDPVLLAGGPTETRAVEPDPGEDERLAFVKVVLADTEDVWTTEFRRLGESYRPPQLVVFRDRYLTGCGLGDARVGPFYCPADRKIYIDLRFYDELAQELDAPGDFAQAYVLAHEVGHHVQHLLGLPAQLRQGSNEDSVRLELQADFLAGVWAKHNARYLSRGDIEEAVRAANQIGDDALQERSQGRVVPHAFTHGTSEQRERWFRRGLDSGRIEDGDTFSVAYEDL
jgi:predicted metalloprotease